MAGTLCLLRPDRAGDALKTLPVLRALLDTRPDWNVHLVLSAHNAALFALEPGCTLHVLPPAWESLPASRLKEITASFFSRPCDLVINLLCDPREGTEALLSSLPAVRKISAVAYAGCEKVTLPGGSPARRDESDNISRVVGSALGLSLPDFREYARSPRFSEEDEREALEELGEKKGRWLGICPFAGMASRQWPLRSWKALARRALRKGACDRLFLFGNRSDSAKLREIEGRLRSDHVRLCYPTSFRTLGAYLKRLDGVIAADSGPLHLAQALGIRSLGILSGGDRERWFSRTNPGDRLVWRGIFHKYPSVFHVLFAFQRWESEKPL